MTRAPGRQAPTTRKHRFPFDSWVIRVGKTQRFDKREGEAGAIESRGNPLSRSGGCMYVHMYTYDDGCRKEGIHYIHDMYVHT